MPAFASLSHSHSHIQTTYDSISLAPSPVRHWGGSSEPARRGQVWPEKLTSRRQTARVAYLVLLQIVVPPLLLDLLQAQAVALPARFSTGKL